MATLKTGSTRNRPIIMSSTGNKKPFQKGGAPVKSAIFEAYQKPLLDVVRRKGVAMLSIKTILDKQYAERKVLNKAIQKNLTVRRNLVTKFKEEAAGIRGERAQAFIAKRYVGYQNPQAAAQLASERKQARVGKAVRQMFSGKTPTEIAAIVAGLKKPKPINTGALKTGLTPKAAAAKKQKLVAQAKELVNIMEESS